MRKLLRQLDYTLLIAVCLLVIFGVVMIGSATYQDGSNESMKQLVWFGLGLMLMTLAAAIDYRFISQFYIVIYIMCILLLVAVLIYGYIKGDGVARWFELGPAKLQPSEFSKLFVIIFLSAFINKYHESMDEPATLFVLAVLVALPVGLVMAQPSLSAALVLLAISLVIVFTGGIPFKYVGVATAATVPASILFIQDVLRPDPLFADKLIGGYQIKRILTFVNPAEDSDAYYQTLKSIEAIGSGQLEGKGLYNGLIIQFSRLPFDHTDFIFSVIGEELGFMGCIAVLAVMLFIIIKCLIVAQSSADLLGRLIASGVAGMFAFQVFVNVGVATGLLPNTGMPFPFVSYGGSSLWINMTAIGLVLNVSMRKNKSLFEG